MKTFKLGLLLALVFFAGVVSGVVGTRAVVRRVVAQAIAHPDRVQTMIERRLTRQLQLDGDQEAKLHGILTDAHGQLDELRGQFRPQIVVILNHTDEQITAMLTPEQQKRFEAMRQRNHPLMRALQQNQNP